MKPPLLVKPSFDDLEVSVHLRQRLIILFVNTPVTLTGTFRRISGWHRIEHFQMRAAVQVESKYARMIRKQEPYVWEYFKDITGKTEFHSHWFVDYDGEFLIRPDGTASLELWAGTQNYRAHQKKQVDWLWRTPIFREQHTI